jgi:hypothetical protein
MARAGQAEQQRDNAVEGLHYRFNCLIDGAQRALGKNPDVDRDYCELCSSSIWRIIGSA